MQSTSTPETQEVEIISKIIRERASELNYSQRYIANRIGVSNSTISLLFSGKSQPNFSTVVRVLDLLGLQVVIAKKGLITG